MAQVVCTKGAWTKVLTAITDDSFRVTRRITATSGVDNIELAIKDDRNNRLVSYVKAVATGGAAPTDFEESVDTFGPTVRVQTAASSDIYVYPVVQDLIIVTGV